MRKILLNLILCAVCALCGLSAHAQRLAVKSNAIEWVTLNPNVGLEMRISQHMTFDISLATNPFPVTIAGYRWSNLRVTPGVRYYFSRPMVGHFVGVAGVLGSYNLTLNHFHHLHGAMAGLGVTYGYAMVINRHWNMEAEIGLGGAYARAKNWHSNKTDMPQFTNYRGIIPIPVRLGLSFAYIF